MKKRLRAPVWKGPMYRGFRPYYSSFQKTIEFTRDHMGPTQLGAVLGCYRKTKDIRRLAFWLNRVADHMDQLMERK